MSYGDVKGIVASVLARLRNHAKSTGAPFQQVLQQYTDKIVEDREHFALPWLRSFARNDKLTQQWKAGKGWLDP